MSANLLALIPEADREEVLWRVEGMLRFAPAHHGPVEPLRADRLPDAWLAVPGRCQGCGGDHTPPGGRCAWCQAAQRLALLVGREGCHL